MQRAGWLLAYTVVSLLSDWLDFRRQPMVHLGGFAFGLAGGFLCGHKFQPRAPRWRLWRLGVVVAICAGLIGLTAWGVSSCSSKAQKHSFTMPEFWKVLRSKRGEVNERHSKPLTLQEYGDLHRFLCKVRVDTWRALAQALKLAMIICGAGVRAGSPTSQKRS
jgi:hypothetical protein